MAEREEREENSSRRGWWRWVGRGQRDMTHGVKNRWWVMEGERKCGGRTSEERGERDEL